VTFVIDLSANKLGHHVLVNRRLIVSSSLIDGRRVYINRLEGSKEVPVVKISC